MSEHGTDELVVEADLDRWGAAQRAGGARRPGDLDAFLGRARARQVRRRAVGLVAAGSMAVVALLVGAAIAKPDAEQVGTTGPAATAPVDQARPAPTSTARFDPSPPDGADEAWALEITFDPTVWSFARIADEVPRMGDAIDRSVPGHAMRVSRVSDAVVDVGVASPIAESTVRELAARLEAQPGIVSVVIGSVPALGDWPPSATAPSSVPPTTAVPSTTVDPLADTGIPPHMNEFDPSPPDDPNDVWAVEITFDRSVWTTFEQFTSGIGQRLDDIDHSPVGAGALSVPVSDTTLAVGVVSADGEATVNEWARRLRAEPGIVSVRIGSMLLHWGDPSSARPPSDPSVSGVTVPPSTP